MAQTLLPETLTSFDKLEYRRPDMARLSDHFRRARLRLRLAMSAHAAQGAILELQPPLVEYQTMAVLARIRHDLQTRHSFYIEEVDFYDTQDVQVAQLTQSTYAALQASRFRNELNLQLGPAIFRKAQVLRDTVQPQVLADLAEENRMASAYQQHLAEAQIECLGLRYTLAGIQPLLESSERLVRFAAHRSLAAYYTGEGPWLDELFDRMVKTRTGLAQKLGYGSFTDLAYRRMERHDYGREQVSQFRDLIQRYFVPITREIRRLQKRRLNLDTLYYYDLPCLFPQGNPPIQIPRHQLSTEVGRVMQQLFGETPSFFDQLDESGFIDTVARPDKVQGGYCETLMGPQVPFILTNAGGTSQDVSTLVHEAGHAYASLQAFTRQKVIEDHRPSLETCEIHSMALEYLSYPFMQGFFGEAADAYTLMHMTESLLFLPYGCLVDEFQHEVYDHPELDSTARRHLWRELEKKYQPDIDYGLETWFVEGGAWQKKEHIFVAPFYYIDYCLAQLAALDLWQLARKNRSQAMTRYHKLCAAGGQMTFLELLDHAGVASPFDEATIKRLAFAVCEFLSL
jgi:M3 family oligoendopeptidase